MSEDLWWPVYGPDVTAVVELLRSRTLLANDWSADAPHQPVLALALISEVEEAEFAVEDGDPYDAVPAMSGLLLSFGANPHAQLAADGATVLEYCDARRSNGAVRHPRAAALLRLWAQHA